MSYACMYSSTVQVQYSTVLYSTTVQYSTSTSTVQYSTKKSTVQCSTVQYSISTVQYSTVQYSTVQYSTVQYSTVQYSTVHGFAKVCDVSLTPSVRGSVFFRLLPAIWARLCDSLAPELPHTLQMQCMSTCQGRNVTYQRHKANCANLCHGSTLKLQEIGTSSWISAARPPALVKRYARKGALGKYASASRSDWTTFWTNASCK